MDAISTFLAISVANLEVEMRDLRLSHWGAIICIGVSFLVIYVNHPVTKFGWGPFSIPAALMLVFALRAVAVFARHDMRILKLDAARRKKMLEPLP